ncbi:MAG: methionyl-tRNA formyltransferase [Eggerthellaceae bacterium]|nr:methionyl-tRNA formyltransferase [Eggerthellaceae bacterium]
MRVVFMGTPAFSAGILEDLLEHHEVVAVYTRADAVRGRGGALLPSPVKELAMRANIPVHSPRTLRDEEEQRILAAYEPEVICVAAYGMLLPKAVLDIPEHGCLNVHASLLPRWRGAAPIEHAILAGDEQAGVCIMRMEEGMDTGAYCICRATDIAGKSAARLTDELSVLGSRALLTALELAADGALTWVEQDESLVTLAPKIAKGALNLDPCVDAAQNARRVQASSEPHPARCAIGGKGVTVLASATGVDEAFAQELSALAPGVARLVRKRLFLGCADGPIEVLEVKPDGKKAMDAKSFAAGMQQLKNGMEWSRIDV